MRKTSYQRSLDSSDLRLISTWKNKSGYRIAVFERLDGDRKGSKTIDVYRGSWFLGYLDSGWGDYMDATDYLNPFEDLLESITDKIARRYFLRLVRSFPIHSGTVYGDFLNPNNTVNWDKVKEYESKFPENTGYVYFRELSKREKRKLQKK